MSQDNLFDEAVKVASGGGGFAAVLLSGRWLLNWATGRFDRVQARLDAQSLRNEARIEAFTQRLETRLAKAEAEAAQCHRDKRVIEERLAVLEGLGRAGDALAMGPSLRALARHGDAPKGPEIAAAPPERADR